MRSACTAARNPNPISTRIFEKADKPFQNHAMPGRLCYLPGIAPESLQPLTYNENRDYIDCDEFICHKCGIHVEDWKQIKIDPDDGEKELCEYKFKHCPECGAKVTSHKSCEFCRWHLQDGTCFNKHHSQPVTGREASCWNWEERE